MTFKRMLSGLSTLGVALLVFVVFVHAGDLNPPEPPGHIMKSLQDLYDKLENIRGVVDSPAYVLPRTGQSISYAVGDDGYYQAGISWPSPRFTLGSDTNIVIDELTELQWCRDANIGGQMAWSDAVDFCSTLVYGGYDDWRLPNRIELLSIIDVSQYSPALPLGHPFQNVENENYWSSTPYSTTHARRVNVSSGHSIAVSMNTQYYVWPVRGP